MLTQVGKFLRKLRIDHSEFLADMADKLSVTPSFLSAVENGKKKFPKKWRNQIVLLYSLSDEQQKDFLEALDDTEVEVKMNLENVSQANRNLALAFARRFSKFSPEEIEQIKAIIDKNGDD